MLEVFVDGRQPVPFTRMVALKGVGPARDHCDQECGVVVDLELGPSADWPTAQALLEQLCGSAHYIVVIPPVLLDSWPHGWLQWFKKHSNWSLLLPLMEFPQYVLDCAVSLYVHVTCRSAVSHGQRLSVHPKIGIFVEEYNEPVLAAFLLSAHTVVMMKDVRSDLSKLCRTLKRQYRYSNYVISPLNPLASDLDLGVYTQFQTDRHKYVQYENAISLALGDLGAKYGSEEILILVIGPGTGVLVDILMKYYQPNFGITIVEKNPKTWTGLEEKCAGVWKNKVTLVKKDVRKYTAKKKPHLVVSEMLGSFGCNELCPEILHSVHAELMIPSSHCSKVRPIFTPLAADNPLPVHSPFLQQLYRFYPLSDQFYQLWEYTYPGSIFTSKSSSTEIAISTNGTINAFEGVFEAELYFNSITNHNCHTTERNGTYCNSWFPIIFPIDPIEVKRGETVKVQFHRTSQHKVWYSWGINGTTYNQNGEFSIDLLG